YVMLRNDVLVLSVLADKSSESGELSWDAFHTYEDASVVEWDGEPDAEEPASVTKVVEGDATAQHDDETEESPESTEEEANNTDNGNDATGSNNWLPISLAGVAILLALISLFRKRS